MTRVPNSPPSEPTVNASADAGAHTAPHPLSESGIFTRPDILESPPLRDKPEKMPGLGGLKRHSLRWNLRASIIDGTAYSLMVGLGEQIIPPFLLAMHPGAAVEMGLVFSIPFLMGAIGQLASPRIIRRLRSHRQAAVLYTYLQAASQLTLAVAAFLNTAPIWLIFAVASVHWGAGLAAGGAWSTWMPSNVPKRVRPKYFGKRNRSIQIGVVLGLLASGFCLKEATGTSYLMAAFGCLFFAAAVTRCISGIYQQLQAEPVPMSPDHRSVLPRELLSRLGHSSGMRLLTYMLSVQFTVCIALHYLNPFALDFLGFDYVQYQLLIAAPYVARMVALPMCGSFAQRYGARRLLLIGGVGLVPLSAVWMVSDTFAILFAVQLLAGMIWASYELSTFLLILDTIHESERTSIMTTYYLGNAAAMVAGSVIGGSLISQLDKTHAAYMTVFAISFFARFASLWFLYRFHGHTNSELKGASIR
ncbi:MAG: MFS transporter [Pyrinomonadaceae bacterium]|nr:MFS transporter [Phycisphaerales bacterium]